jgi:hypothetical protein
LKRQFALVVALVAWFALVVQLVVSIRMGIARGNGWPYGLWMYVAFFTVTTNLLVAVASLIVAVAPDSRRGRKLGNPDSLTGIAASIILVCITYNAILAGLWKPHGWQLAADLALHDVVPILFVVFWWIAVPRGSIRFRRAALWALYPIAYFAYAMLRGLVTDFYPYPFINVRELGFFWVIVNALGVLLAFFIILTVLTGVKVSFRATASRETAA